MVLCLARMPDALLDLTLALVFTLLLLTNWPPFGLRGVVITEKASLE